MELSLISYVDLFIQIILFGVLILDYFHIRRKSLRQHGALMASAFITNTILIVVVMILPFLAEGTEILENMFTMESLLFFSHHFLGLIAELLGAFLLLKWGMKKFNISLCKGKNIMKATLATWLISILLGIAIFILHLIE